MSCIHVFFYCLLLLPRIYFAFSDLMITMELWLISFMFPSHFFLSLTIVNLSWSINTKSVFELPRPMTIEQWKIHSNLSYAIYDRHLNFIQTNWPEKLNVLWLLRQNDRAREDGDNRGFPYNLFFLSYAFGDLWRESKLIVTLFSIHPNWS